jgi:hypothetical protein
VVGGGEGWAEMRRRRGKGGERVKSAKNGDFSVVSRVFRFDSAQKNAFFERFFVRFMPDSLGVSY